MTLLKILLCIILIVGIIIAMYGVSEIMKHVDDVSIKIKIDESVTSTISITNETNSVIDTTNRRLMIRK